MRCMTAARHLSKKVQALLFRACSCVDSTSCSLSALLLPSTVFVTRCGSSKLIRSGAGALFLGAGGGLVAVGEVVSCVLSGSKVATRSLRMSSMQRSIRRANSTRRAGVSRTELSDAPSSFVLFGASPEMALAKLENMLYYEGSSKFNG
jgi:hypothetical protein